MLWKRIFPYFDISVQSSKNTKKQRTVSHCIGKYLKGGIKQLVIYEEKKGKNSFIKVSLTKVQTHRFMQLQIDIKPVGSDDEFQFNFYQK